ncbi:MAG: hypothetical protein FGM24_08210 [Candidatus Kapabacteria bacterium]|nr:hypothetical protein [Candidatus Kapabacteria bacterium]
MLHMSSETASSAVSDDTVRPDHIHAAWQSVAVIARPSVGWVRMRGTDRLDLLQRLTTNDLASLRPGSGKHTVLLTDKARVIDVLAVLHDEHETMLLCSGGNAGRVRAWLRNYVIMDDVQVADCSTEVTAIEWTGPHAPLAIRQILGIDASTLPMCGWVDHAIDGAACRTIRIPSTCELSYLTILPAGKADAVQTDMLPTLTPAEAEYLRVMGGMGRLGAEWTDAYNPLEAGLLHMVSFSKGCYIGQEVVARLDTYNKVKQRIMGIVSNADIAPDDVIVIEGTDVGRVTSVVHGMTSATRYALGYVRHEHALADTAVTLRTAHGDASGTLAALPMREA